MDRPPAVSCSVRAVLWAAVATGLLLSGAWSASTALSSSRKDRERALVAVAYPFHGITVFSATGKRIRTWKRKWNHAGSRKSSVEYWEPYLHPSGKRLVCVKCVLGYADEKSYPATPQSGACELSELSIAQGDERTLLSLADVREISSPAYAPDGETVAFVQDDAVVLASVREQRIIRTIPRVVATQSPAGLPDPPKDGLPRTLSSARLRWSSDGSAVFVYGPRPLSSHELPEPLPAAMYEARGVATVALGSGQVSWLNIYLWSVGGPRHWEIRDGTWAEVNETLPGVEPIQALFGSENHPRRDAQFTSDGKAFMYVDLRSGLFWRDRLMRYDIATNELELVRTLASGLSKE